MATNHGVKTRNRISKVAKKKTAKKTPEPGARIAVPEIKVERRKLKLVGLDPLICHRFGEKERKKIINQQTGEAAQSREYRDPEEEYRSSMYMVDSKRYGFPALAFKQAAVTACSAIKGSGLTKVLARQSHFVKPDHGTLVILKGKPKMREDDVRIRSGVTIPRWRAEFWPWSVELNIDLQVNIMSLKQLVNLYNLAGFSVGVGEWRPEKDGVNGRYEVE